MNESPKKGGTTDAVKMGQRCSCIKRQTESDYNVKLRLKRNNTWSTYRPKGAQYIGPQIEDHHTTWKLREGVPEPHNEEINV